MSEENSQSSVDDDWAAAMAEQADSDAGADWGDALAEQAAAKKVREPELTGGTQLDQDMPTGDIDMGMILDIPVTISMEIGRTKINIRNLLQLNQGSIVELDRLAGEPMDVLVNGTLIAHGEVVVVNEKFGIRLTDVISPAERVKKLR